MPFVAVSVSLTWVGELFQVNVTSSSKRFVCNVLCTFLLVTVERAGSSIVWLCMLVVAEGIARCVGGNKI